jgi:multimeric flavodoxin WrbA
MKIYAVNASPRKNGNTATLLNKALEGARSVSPDVETEIIHLYDYKYSGCISCYACKRKGSPSLGKCAVRDGITLL